MTLLVTGHLLACLVWLRATEFKTKKVRGVLAQRKSPVLCTATCTTQEALIQQTFKKRCLIFPVYWHFKNKKKYTHERSGIGLVSLFSTSLLKFHPFFFFFF